MRLCWNSFCAEWDILHHPKSYCNIFHESVKFSVSDLLHVRRCLIECRDEYKYNVEAVELLIRNHLVNMQQYELHLAQVHTFLLLWVVSLSVHCH